MANVIIYTTTQCPYCNSAKKLLAKEKINYTEVNIENDSKRRDEMIQLSGKRTVPQIFISIGGFDDLSALVAKQALTKIFE
jgi:glutaredoxin 3